MRILVDENIPLMTIDELRRKGHDVEDIHEAGKKGLLDTKVWARAQEESRLLITTDKGFARYHGTDHCGVLIVRLHQPNRYTIHERVMWAIGHFPEEEWRGTIVTTRDRVAAVSRYAREENE